MNNIIKGTSQLVNRSVKKKKSLVCVFVSSYIHSAAVLILCESCEMVFCDGSWTFWQYAQDSRRYEFVMINQGMEKREGYQYWDIFVIKNDHLEILFKVYQSWYSSVLALNHSVAFAQLPSIFLALQTIHPPPRHCGVFFFAYLSASLLSLSLSLIYWFTLVLVALTKISHIRCWNSYALH